MKNVKPKIAFIDDEERILRSLKMHFRDTHDVFVTTNADDLMDYIKANDVQVVISDQRMPKKLGVEVLKDVKEASPHTVRILLTGYADLNAVVNSINEGEIFRYVTKPWQTDELKNVVNQATDIALQTKHVMLTQPESTAAPDISHLTKRRVLVMDDHEDVYLQMKNCFANLDVYWAQSLEKAHELLEQQEFGVAIADITLAGENIAPVIYSLKHSFPSLTVMVLTEFKDANGLIDLINKGQVYRYLPRPTNLALLEISLQRAFSYHEQLVAKPELQIRHTVEEVSEKEKSGFSAKIKGFFSRFRNRKASAMT